jgi:FkbM family methyltransferase
MLRLPRVLAAIWGVRLFRQPLKLLKCYFQRRCPNDLLVETRNGYRIHLSGDEDDIVTLLVVMGRKDYGHVPKGGVVIDVGAHLGAFTLCALMQGAGKVYSYEPDPSLQQVLLKNVLENGFNERVEIQEAAVIGSGPGEVVFYQEGNASGRLDPYEGETGGISVKALTLSEIVLANQIQHVDMLKLDCEGSEYGIVFDTPREVWDRIGRVALEYHKGQPDQIRQRFRELGFRLTRFRAHGHSVGLMWFER